MALGWACVLGGGLLSLVPFGFTQALGVSFIAGGIILIGQAAGQGEKPYYRDTETGQITPINPSTPSPSVGVGTSFYIAHDSKLGL